MPEDFVAAANKRMQARIRKRRQSVAGLLDSMAAPVVASNSVTPDVNTSPTGSAPKSKKPLPKDSLMSIIQQAGFSGEAARIAYAVAKAESSGDANQLTDNPRTGDLSYGLFQINMLGSMGPDRRKAYKLNSNNDLFDPLTNAKIAYRMSKGGQNWSPWTAYKNGAYKQFL